GLVKITPAHLDVLGQRLLADRVRSAVGVFVIGGEALSSSTVALWQQIQPGVRLINEYGPTETVVGCVVYDIAPDAQLDGSVPIGRPIANTRIYVLDGYGQPVPVGVAGEIYIGGAGVARGYLNRNELTAERFVADPFSNEPGARMYRTGDLARYRADGNLEFLGRNDHQVKLRGMRIELGEIEAKLAQYRGVKEIAVIAREDQPGDRRLVAYYTEDEPGTVEVDGMRLHLSATLPEYMVPAAYVALDALPLTPNGKLDRQALPAPESGVHATHAYEAPVGDTEIALAAIWADVLKLDKVGRHDNFFQLGGHSLLAVKVGSRVRKVFGSEITVGTVFGKPVLHELARAIRDSDSSGPPPIRTVNRIGPLPLSYAQQRLWFLSRIEEIGAAYHMHMIKSLHGQVDLQALQRSLDRVVMRHESLRTTFHMQDGEPCQHIGPSDTGFALVVDDLRGKSGQRETLEASLQAEAVAPFDLENGPLIRGRLFMLPESEAVLLVTVHHIVSDGWSQGVLQGEVDRLYQAFQSGADDPLPLPVYQYADYAVWQREWVESGAVQEQAEYWRAALQGAPAILALPTDRPRPDHFDPHAQALSMELDKSIVAAIDTLSRNHGMTPFMIVFAAWALVLGRLSAQDDVVIGMPVMNRTRSELTDMVGLLVNTLPLRIDLSGSPSLDEYLERVKVCILQAQANQDLPFEKIVEICNPPRSTAYSPLFQVVLNWEGAETNEPVDTSEANSAVQPVGFVQAAAKFDLALSLREDGGRLTGILEYATALFDEETALRIRACLLNLVEAMVAGSGMTIDTLPLMRSEERHRLLVEWNATKTEYPDHACIHELIEEQAALSPDAVALKHGETTLSYAELNAKANRLARHLRNQGVGPDTRVAICVTRGLDMMVGLLAAWKAGGAYVPLDPAYPRDRLAFMLADSNPAAILTHAQIGEQALEVLHGSAAVVIDLEADRQYWGSQATENLLRSETRVEPDHLAYVIYTSGSTGQPKGVMVAHRGVCNLALAQIAGFDIGADSRVLQFASFSFDACVSEVATTLVRGATLVLPASDTVLAGETLVDVLEQEHITHVTLPPVVLAGLPEEARLETVRTLVMAGEASNAALVRRYGRGRRLINAYGPTESTVCATMQVCAENEEANNREGERAPAIGRPIANTRIYLLDAHGQPVPQGARGEIHIGGVQVARGYLNRDELTAERFLPDPFVNEAGARMYKTGDLGRHLADGSIAFLGRNDHQVKLRGFRIEPGEIEAKLLEHPGIRDSLVIAREDRPGDVRLVAYYTWQEEQEIDAEALRLALSATLPEYMLPAAYVQLDALPLTPNGKVDRKALPAPGGDAYASRAYEAPQGDVETALASIWAEVLGIEQVGRHDNFFDLGGHSLLSTKLLVRVEQAFGVKLSFADFFKEPILTAIARQVLVAQLSHLTMDELETLMGSPE
ncbi:amino acid adenylation domain-containing protein, partial [Herbaspirillum sp. GCM10030257]|uniref:amino acid adenylation domain-containing protein n=1 Tax=Herbaspirillum sp. GCM10030257 TaxID=3273393 RepID=UPI003619CFE8